MPLLSRRPEARQPDGVHDEPRPRQALPGQGAGGADDVVFISPGVCSHLSFAREMMMCSLHGVRSQEAAGWEHGAGDPKTHNPKGDRCLLLHGELGSTMVREENVSAFLAQAETLASIGFWCCMPPSMILVA